MAHNNLVEVRLQLANGIDVLEYSTKGIEHDNTSDRMFTMPLGTEYRFAVKNVTQNPPQAVIVFAQVNGMDITGYVPRFTSIKAGETEYFTNYYFNNFSANNGKVRPTEKFSGTLAFIPAPSLCIYLFVAPQTAIIDDPSLGGLPFRHSLTKQSWQMIRYEGIREEIWHNFAGLVIMHPG